MSRFRVGLMDSILAERPAVEAYSHASYLAAVVNRVDSYWVPDHINGQTPHPLWDPKYTAAARLLRSPDAAMEAWTLLGSLAARRRFNRVRLGVGVTDTGKRHPAVIAQAAATLNLMTRGRTILGIGPGERVGNEPYGVDWSKPVARFEEALATIRALWNSKGELAKRDSPFFPLRDAIFDLPPTKESGPRSGLQRTARACCGRRDATATRGSPGSLIGPRILATPGGRPECSLRRRARSDVHYAGALWMPVIAGPNRDDVDAALDSTVVKAWALNGPAEFYAHHGAQHPMGTDFAGMQDHASFTMDEQTIREKSAQVPLSVGKGMVLNGTVDEVLEQAVEWRQAPRRALHRGGELQADGAKPAHRPRHAVAVQQSGPRPQAAVISAR